MKTMVENPVVLVCVIILAIIGIGGAFFLRKKHPRLAETILLYGVYCICGFYVAMRLFFTFPDLGLVWLMSWLLLGMLAVAISTYFNLKRENNRRF